MKSGPIDGRDIDIISQAEHRNTSFPGRVLKLERKNGANQLVVFWIN